MKVYQIGIGQDVYRDNAGNPICFEVRSEALFHLKILESEVLIGKRESKRIQLLVIK